MNTDRKSHSHSYRAWPPLLFLLIVGLGILQFKTSSFQLLFVFFCASVVAGLAMIVRRNSTESVNRELYRLAYHDELTGLYNRRKFISLLQQKIDSGTAGWLMLIDLDKFKSINDTLGHAAGDSVLQQTATRILSAAGPGSVVARLGGDEFVVITRNSDPAQQERICAKLKEELSKPFKLEKEQAAISASVGGVHFHGKTSTVSALMHKADEEMYRDKHSPDPIGETPLTPTSTTIRRSVRSKVCSPVTDLCMLDSRWSNYDRHFESPGYI